MICYPLRVFRPHCVPELLIYVYSINSLIMRMQPPDDADENLFDDALEKVTTAGESASKAVVLSACRILEEVQISGDDRRYVLEVCFFLTLPDWRWLIPLLLFEDVFLIHCFIICNVHYYHPFADHNYLFHRIITIHEQCSTMREATDEGAVSCAQQEASSDVPYVVGFRKSPPFRQYLGREPKATG